MNVVICPRELAQSRDRFEPTHMVSIQDPGANVSALRPPWVPPENHLVSYFLDEHDPSHPEAPSLDAVGAIIDWLRPRCERGSPNRLLIHCNAGMGRSPAVGYVAWAIHLGPGREAEAHQRMLRSCVRPYIVPNTVVVEHADRILGCDGALCGPLNRWADAYPWARKPR